ncbi:hypothetical protein Bbelb_130120 [Branchiostoma belcheri]|nr:hypothetical protein Bbelb_130120 [Branchiostoma belcheri]
MAAPMKRKHPPTMVLDYPPIVLCGNKRLSENSSTKADLGDTPVSAHFNQPNHTVADMEVIGLEKLAYGRTEDITRQRRLQRESFWIHQLRTLHPEGLNLESLEITRHDYGAHASSPVVILRTSSAIFAITSEHRRRKLPEKNSAVMASSPVVILRTSSATFTDTVIREGFAYSGQLTSKERIVLCVIVDFKVEKLGRVSQLDGSIADRGEKAE